MMTSSPKNDSSDEKGSIRSSIGPLFNARPLLLIALWDGPGYGIQLAQILDKITHGLGSVTDGSIYPALRKLEAAGLVSTSRSEPLPERGGRARIYYTLTEKGLEESEKLRAAFFACSTSLAQTRTRTVPAATKIVSPSSVPPLEGRLAYALE